MFKGMNTSNTPDHKILTDIVITKMPFGKYKNVLVCDLPMSYLEWFAQKGFPNGRLGVMLATMYEIRLNGLTEIIGPLRSISKRN